MSTAFVRNDVHRAEFGSPVLEDSFQSISTAGKVVSTEVYIAGEISNLDDVQFRDVDTTFSQPSVTDDHAEKSVPVC